MFMTSIFRIISTRTTPNSPVSICFAKTLTCLGCIIYSFNLFRFYHHDYFYYYLQATRTRYIARFANQRINLTHIRVSLESLLWDIGKQYSPGCDAAERGVPSGAITCMFAYRNFIEKMKQNFKITPAAPKNESRLAQLIMMGESIRHLWVNAR